MFAYDQKTKGDEVDSDMTAGCVEGAAIDCAEQAGVAVSNCRVPSLPDSVHSTPYEIAVEGAFNESKHSETDHPENDESDAVGSRQVQSPDEDVTSEEVRPSVHYVWAHQ